jgi:phenylacetate-CoA ligase
MKTNTPKTLIFSLSELAIGRKISPKLAILMKQSGRPPEERKQATQHAVIQTVERAGIEIPYYKDLFRRINFKPDSLRRDFKYFLDIPYLTKETLLGSPGQFLPADQRRESLFERKTAGSTGACLSVYYDRESLDWTAAINLFAHQMTGRTVNDREVHLSNDLRTETGKPSLWSEWAENLKALALNRINIQTKSLNREDLLRLYRLLESSDAYLVQGNPSTLYALALFVRDEGFKKIPLFKALESTGESVDAEKATAIETYLGAKVFNRYGCAEFGVMAHSRESIDELEVFSESVFIENFIYGAGIPEIVVTGLLNPVMPLIRYRTGDIGEVGERSGNPVLSKVFGRIHDVVEFKGRQYPTHFFKDLFKKTGGVDEFQFIQKKSGSMELNIVSKNPSNNQHLIHVLSPIFQDSVTIRFIRMSELRCVGWRDKFKHLIRE